MIRMRYLFFLPLAAACTLNVEAASEEKHATWEGDDFGALHADAGNVEGGLTIRGWDEPRADAKAEVVGLVTPGHEHRLRDMRLDFVRREGALELAMRGAAEAFYFEWIDASVPRGTDLVLESDTGDVEVIGMSGRVTAETDTGSIRVATTGRVDLTTDTGDVRARGSGGRIETDTGDVDMRLVDTAEGLRIETDTGNVDLHLPHDANCVLVIDTDTGEVLIDAGGVRARNEGAFRVVIGSGGPTIRITTDTGDVRVLD